MRELRVDKDLFIEKKKNKTPTINKKVQNRDQTANLITKRFLLFFRNCPDTAIRVHFRYAFSAPPNKNLKPLR